MTLDRYQELLSSNNCYTIDNNIQLVLLSPNGRLLIEIDYFSHIEDSEGIEDDSNNRILIFVYPALNLHPELKVTQVVGNKVMIMSDSKNSDKATSYNLFIDEENEEVTLKVNDFPNVGEKFISEKEVIGIHKKLWKPQSVVKA